VTVLWIEKKNVFIFRISGKMNSEPGILVVYRKKK
jgi:hypothetical protein